jgi:Sigma-70 region 2
MRRRKAGSKVESFETYRPYFFSIAYRMLGSAMDAKDMVQETYIRYQTHYQAAEPETIHSLKAYLITILTRLCPASLETLGFDLNAGGAFLARQVEDKTAKFRKDYKKNKPSTYSCDGGLVFAARSSSERRRPVIAPYAVEIVRPRDAPLVAVAGSLPGH